MKKIAKSNVKLFSQAVADLRAHFNEVEPTGTYTARYPLVQKYETEWLIEYLSDGGETVSDLESEYGETAEQFDEFRGAHSEAYREKLQQELEHLSAGYPGLICYFMELEPHEVEVQHDLAVRDAIEFLILELEERRDIRGEVSRVGTLDEVFECEYRRHLDDIQELLDVKELAPLIERPYYPSQFWWRHPSEIED